MGSLICALASYLDARANDGVWLLRMEDLDPPREPAASAQSILASLQAHGLNWDGEVLYQSQRHNAYAAIVQQLLSSQSAFRCDCTRAQLIAQDNIYRGRCRQQQPGDEVSCSIRVLVNSDSQITIEDQLQQPLYQDLSQEVGDFIIQRKDGLYAYQLAVVIDDAFQGITRVVRGSDLYDSTPRQVYLQHVLGYPTPLYTHIPVITNDQGQKLSKQTHAAALIDTAAKDNLRRALGFLGQVSPRGDHQELDALLREAANNWRPAAVPACMAIPESSLG